MKSQLSTHDPDGQMFLCIMGSGYCNLQFLLVKFYSESRWPFLHIQDRKNTSRDRSYTRYHKGSTLLSGFDAQFENDPYF
ncbi:hypothetical protein FKM82_000668 [Ascaphus truei]